MIKRITVLLSALMMSGIAAAQEELQAPAPDYCETNEGFADFDFWVGEWKVYATGTDKVGGTNVIAKAEAGCLITEHWTNIQGGTGQSYNYYNPVKDEWRQVWVASGNAIDYTGGLNDAGEMVLTGHIYVYSNGTAAPFRGTWTPNEDGSVRQFFEQQDDEGKWNTWFDGTYVKVEDGGE